MREHLIEQLREDKFLFFIPFLVILVRLVIFILVPNVYEDAFITFRYAENLAAGNGFVFNPGETVMGTTTPLFALLLAFFKLMGISCLLSSLLINLLAEGTTALIIYILLRDYSKSRAAFIPSLLYVFSPSNISWAISGMETAFYGAVIALSFYFLIKEKYLPAMVFAFLSAMIRIDGLSVALVAGLISLFKEKPFRSISILLPLCIFICWELVLYAIFGSLLPTTLQAKLTLYSGHQSSKFTALSVILTKFFLKDHYLSSLVTAIFLAGSLIVFFKRINYYGLIIWFFVYYGAMAWSNTMMHGWYFVPPLFAFVAIVGVAIMFVYNFLAAKTNLRLAYISIILVVPVLAFSAITLSSKIEQIRQENVFRKFRTNIGNYIAENTPPDSKLYLEPIGIIGYYSKRYIFDDAGLVSPQFIKFNRMEQTMANIAKKIEFANPDFIILRIYQLPDFYKAPELYSKYREIKRFEYFRGSEQLGMSLFVKN